MGSELRRRGIPVHEKGAALGVAELDGAGHVPMAQLPAAIVDGMTPRGGWDASGSTYPVPNNVGDFWWITVAGTIGGVDYEIDDWLVYVDDSPVTWDKIDNTDKVTSIFARTGAVVAAASDYDASQIDNDSAVGGAFVKDALDAIAIGGIGKKVYVDPTTGNDGNNGNVETRHALSLQPPTAPTAPMAPIFPITPTTGMQTETPTPETRNLPPPLPNLNLKPNKFRFFFLDCKNMEMFRVIKDY